MLEDLYGGFVPPPPPLPPTLPRGMKPAVHVDPSTDGFLHLYHRVTDGIDTHARDRCWQPFEALFFDYAVAGFFVEYVKWSSAPINTYLTLFHNVRYRALQVVGHAYLHVAYDLPRVLVQELDAAQEMRDALDQRFTLTPWHTSTGVIIERYLDLQEVMRHSLRSAARDATIFGKLAYLLRFLPGRSHFLDVFGNWVLVLRSNALLYAQMTAGMRPSDSTRFQQIYDAAKNVVKTHPSNPIAWFGGGGFKTWFGAAMLPVALFAQLQPIAGPTPWPVTVGLGLLTVAVVGLGAIRVIDAWLASFADTLGRAIWKAITNPGTDTDTPPNQDLVPARGA